MEPRLDILGCGRLGRTIGRLVARAGAARIGEVATRSLASAQDAVDFIGSGRAVERGFTSPPSDLVLIATPDDAIADRCRALAEAGSLAGCAVFHCSGAASSDLLAPARDAGAQVASVHPVRSFADPARAADAFDGTWCGFEGDAAALERLRPLFDAIGARAFALDADTKSIYHAGTVLACNALVALLETGLRCLEQAGLEREVATSLLEPLVAGTVANVFATDTTEALTGPIARGEAQLVARQLADLEAADPQAAQVYRVLGRTTLELARAQGGAPSDALDVLERILA